jgi:hypothetical protein
MVSTSWSVFSYIIHFHLQKCFYFIFSHFYCLKSQIRQQLTNIKQNLFISIRAFDSRLYLDISRSFKWKESFIFRYFKVFQLFQLFTCVLSDFVLPAVGSLVVFVLREYILKVHILVSSEHRLCQTGNTCIVPCIYWSIAFLSKLLIFF